MLERSSEERRKELIDLLRRCHEEESAVDELQRIVTEEEGIKYAAETMHAYIARAMHLLSKYPDTPYRASLMKLCAFIADRDK